jgi:hypothetical protein
VLIYPERHACIGRNRRPSFDHGGQLRAITTMGERIWAGSLLRRAAESGEVPVQDIRHQDLYSLSRPTYRLYVPLCRRQQGAVRLQIALPKDTQLRQDPQGLWRIGFMCRITHGNAIRGKLGPYLLVPEQRSPLFPAGCNPG